MKLLYTAILAILCTFSYGADYYWVGGSGNWSDISHWAAVSGGNVTYPVAPSSEDNVIFDENSFTATGQTVTFKNSIVFCKNMDWTQATNVPRLEGLRSVTLSVFGDLLLTPDMVFAYDGKVLMAGIAEDKDIDLAGHEIPGVLQFAGESTWSVNSNVLIDSMMMISRGSVMFNSNAISCRFLHINTTGQKTVDFSNSEITISGNYQDEFGFDGDGSISCIIEHTNLAMNAVGSRIEITAPNAVFRYLGNSDLSLNELAFTATGGSVTMTSLWYDEHITINELSFASSARIEGTVNTDLLSLAAGGRYRFGAERTYVIGNIVAMSDCQEGVIIISDNPGFAAIFQVPASNIDLNYITLRDIHGTGASTLNAENGVDLGNNDGWNFTNSVAVDYYWVGGSGRWNDPMHWSLSSGGGPSGCVPSGKDNVFFDVNSFTGPNQSVELASRSTFIHDMTWNGVTNEPEFTGIETQRMVVTGSLELDANMEHDVQGFYDFESSESGKTIRTNGKIFNESITFSGRSADWTFVDDVEVYRFIYFQSGRLSTGGNELVTTRILSRTEQERELDISGSYVLLRESINEAPEWVVDMENYAVNADNSTIEFRGRATLRHGGASNIAKPRYDNVIMESVRGAVSSADDNTPENETAIIINDLTFTGRGNMSGSTEVGILRLAEGFSYVFDSYFGRKQVVGDILTSGSCENGNTLLFGGVPGEAARIELLNNTTLERMYIIDIEILGAQLMNNNSVDGGNNEGMTFVEQMGRVLYWVGDGGLWQDPAHWSLSSGGPGGECIPTALDDVFFDANSFSMDGELVESVPFTYAHCNNLSVTGTTGFPQLQLDFVLIDGSLETDDDFLNNVEEFIFTSKNAATVTVNGQEFNRLRIRGGGSFIFMDDIVFNRYIHNAGEVTFADVSVVCNNMEMEGEIPKIINLGDSELVIYESGAFGFNDRGRNLTVNPGNSEISFTGEDVGVFSRSGISLNRVVFENSTGKGYFASRYVWDTEDMDGIMSVAVVRFNGDGEVLGHLVSDSITGVAGKIYTFQSARDVDVSSYLQLRGNNCTPIELRGSANSEHARINMPPDAELVVDFVQMSDMNASGGADFNAGSRSVNVGGSNIGWTFQDAPDFIETGFLGTDLAICMGDPVTLTAYSYSPNEQYLWSDGSTDSSLMVTIPGQYFVEVQFESDCVLRDTVDILDGDIYETGLPDSSAVCGGTFLLLDAEVVADHEVTYSWNDGSMESSLEVNSEGKYTVQVEGLNCVTLDSTYVTFVDDPGTFLPLDSTLCAGDEFLVRSMLPGESYGWSDGSEAAEYLVDDGELVWLDLSYDGCTFRDTFIVESVPLPNLDLGSDTTICAGEELTLSVIPELDALWSDGSSGSSIVVEDSGMVSVIVTSGVGCENSDSLSVMVVSAPEPDLGNDIVACAGDFVELGVNGQYDDYLWDDGSSGSGLSVSQEGEYMVEVFDNGCPGSDAIKVSFLSLPVIELGPADTLACEDFPLRINAVRSLEHEIVWQDLSEEDFFDATVPGLVRATVFDGSCTNVDSIQVSFKECVFFDYYAPNAFSPNDDGHNDRFQIFFPEGLIIEEYTMTIFDRWGNRVHDSAEVGSSWDGKLATSDLQNGVYVYQIFVDYVDENGPGSEVIVGDVAIMK